MLPDYPKLKEKVKRQFILHMKNHMKRNFPLQGMAKHQIVHEGTNPQYQVEFKGNYEYEQTNIKTFSANIFFDKNELRSMSMRDIYERYIEMADNMGKDVELSSLQELSDTLKKRGQTTKISKSLTPEDILKTFEPLLISFDKNGNPKLPTIMAAPKTADKFGIALKKLDEEPYRTDFKNLIDKKRKEWNDRENSRKLVE